MKITELIEKLNKILEEDGDLEVWIDSANEIEFGDIESVEGQYYSQRSSNNNPHVYIKTNIEAWKDYG